MLACLDHPANYFSIFRQRGTPQGAKNVTGSREGKHDVGNSAHVDELGFPWEQRPVRVSDTGGAGQASCARHHVLSAASYGVMALLPSAALMSRAFDSIDRQ